MAFTDLHEIEEMFSGLSGVFEAREGLAAAGFLYQVRYAERTDAAREASRRYNKWWRTTPTAKAYRVQNAPRRRVVEAARRARRIETGEHQRYLARSLKTRRAQQKAWITKNIERHRATRRRMWRNRAAAKRATPEGQARAAAWAAQKAEWAAKRAERAAAKAARKAEREARKDPSQAKRRAREQQYRDNPVCKARAKAKRDARRLLKRANKHSGVDGPLESSTEANTGEYAGGSGS